MPQTTTAHNPPLKSTDEHLSLSQLNDGNSFTVLQEYGSKRKQYTTLMRQLVWGGGLIAILAATHYAVADFPSSLIWIVGGIVFVVLSFFYTLFAVTIESIWFVRQDERQQRLENRLARIEHLKQATIDVSEPTTMTRHRALFERIGFVLNQYKQRRISIGLMLIVYLFISSILFKLFNTVPYLLLYLVAIPVVALVVRMSLSVIFLDKYGKSQLEYEQLLVEKKRTMPLFGEVTLAVENEQSGQLSQTMDAGCLNICEAEASLQSSS